VSKPTLTVSDAVARLRAQATYHTEEAARLYRVAENEPKGTMKTHYRELARDQDVRAQTILHVLDFVSEIGRIG
jgi:hypothetical protein